MFFILEEDLVKIYPEIQAVVRSLSAGMQRVERPVHIGEDIAIFKITGYWITDGIRLDIKLEK